MMTKRSLANLHLRLVTFTGGRDSLVVASGRLIALKDGNCPKKQEKSEGSYRILRHSESEGDRCRPAVFGWLP